MNVSLQNKKSFVLRFDKGEEVIEELAKFMQDQDIEACVFYGIGSAYEVVLGYFNAYIKSYRKKPFYEENEIVSLTGNGAMLEGKPIIHAHGIFSRNDFSLIGGHVFKLIVNVTCEVYLTKLEGFLERKNNPEFDLKLLM